MTSISNSRSCELTVAAVLVVFLFVLGAVTFPVGAQKPEAVAPRSTDSVAELREQLRAAEKVAAELRARLMVQPNLAFAAPGIVLPELGMLAGPGASGYLTLLGRKPRIGVNVRAKADPKTDSLGAVLDGVVEGGPAAEAGLKAGDIITHWQGEALTGRYPGAGDGQSEPASKLVDLARELEEGDQVEVIYQRGGKSAKATIAARKLDSLPLLGSGFGFRGFDGDGDLNFAMPSIADLGKSGSLTPFTVWSRGGWSDVELLKVGPELGQYFGTDRGLLVVRPPSDNKLGLAIGDVILQVGDREPRDTTHLLRILRNYDAGETINVEVMRQKKQVTLSAEAPAKEAPGAAAWNGGFAGRDSDAI